jgi:superoxide reductase
MLFHGGQSGPWVRIESMHVTDKAVSDSQLTMDTPQPTSELHYIVSHTVVAERGKFADGKTFTRKDQPSSTHTLPADCRGEVTVTSTCDLHDFSMKTITV